jgi:hypothetical protein
MLEFVYFKNEKVQKCTQRSTKPTHKTKDRVAEPY